MKNWSDVKTDDTRAAEIGVIVHEGREFASGGFSIDLERGKMIAYVTAGKCNSPYCPPERCNNHSLTLTTWDGGHLARLKHTGTSQGWHRTTLEHYQTIDPIAGFYWYGKGLGAGMMLRLSKGRAFKQGRN